MIVSPLRTIAGDEKTKIERKARLLQLTSQMKLRRPLPSLAIAIEMMMGILLMLMLKMEERR